MSMTVESGGGDVRKAARCRTCRRPVPGRHHRDWSRECAACSAYRRRTGRRRPFVLDGRREAKGQRVLSFARALPARG